MEIKRFKGLGISTLQSSIRTGGQKVRQAEQKIKSDLTTATMQPEEENEEQPSDKKGSGNGWKSRQWGRNAKNDKQKRELAKAQLQKKQEAKMVLSRKGSKGASKSGKLAGSAKSSTASGASHGAAQGAAQSASSAAAGAAKGAATAVGGAVKGAAAAGGTAAAGAATGGIVLGVVVIKKGIETARKAARRIKANLETTVEMEQKKRTEVHGKRRGSKEAFGEGEGGDSGKALSGVSFLGMFKLCAGSMLIMGGISMGIMSCSGGNQTQEGLTIVAVAEQEEIDSGYNIGGDKYKHWYGMDDNWCAMFVSWCGEQCGYIKEGIMPRTASVANMAQWYMKKNLYQRKESGYEPKAGDIIIFGNGISHTGIVVEYDSAQKIVTTIEGNTGTSYANPYHKGSQVKKKRYPLNYKYTVGYGTPEYPAEDETEMPEERGVT